MKFIPCAYCGKRLHNGERVIRYRNFTGFYFSYQCLVFASGIGYEDFVTDELVEGDRESSGYGWEEE